MRIRKPSPARRTPATRRRSKRTSSRNSNRELAGGFPAVRSARALATIAMIDWRSTAGNCVASCASASSPASSRSRQVSAAWKPATAARVVPLQASSRAEIGAGSISRISRPMYCICRRFASHFVNRRKSPSAATRSSGRLNCLSLSGASSASRSPRSCSACIWILRRVFDGGADAADESARSCSASAWRRVEGMLAAAGGENGFVMIADLPRRIG